MALWDKLSQRGNVQDRRGLGPVGIGGLGVGGVVLTLLFTYLSGGSMTDALWQLGSTAVLNQPVDTAQFEGEDAYEVFASTVLGSNNELWTSAFAEINRTYTPPTLVLFRGQTQSSCGNASSAIGPHYCPLDETIYLDETFFEALEQRLGAVGGDVAEAYVIAHEVGHHVQQDLGLLQGEQTNAASIQTELQADCLAGVWFNSITDDGVLEEGEIKEALDAASAVGDDKIQAATQGEISPESWTHGSSQQRLDAVVLGYNNGTLAACIPAL